MTPTELADLRFRAWNEAVYFLNTKNKPYKIDDVIELAEKIFNYAVK